MDPSVICNTLAAEWGFCFYDPDLGEGHFPGASVFTRRRFEHGMGEVGLVPQRGIDMDVTISTKSIGVARELSVAESAESDRDHYLRNLTCAPLQPRGGKPDDQMDTGGAEMGCHFLS